MSPDVPPQRQMPLRYQRLLRFTIWAYLLSLVVAWLLLKFTADWWWLSTLFLFGPRWVVAVPLIVVVPSLLVLSNVRLVLTAGIPTAVCLLSILGFCLPVPLIGTQDDTPVLRVLSCNVGRGPISELLALIQEQQPDLVALQEATPEHADALATLEGWHVSNSTRLVVASRFPIVQTDRVLDAPGWRSITARHRIRHPAGDFDFFDVHLATPRSGIQAMIGKRLQGIPEMQSAITMREAESRAAVDFIGEAKSSCLIAGDFNMPVEGQIYRQYWSTWSNAFSKRGLGFGYTKQTSWFGARIDHILASPKFRVLRCWVGRDIGSDHLPVFADVEFTTVEADRPSTSAAR